MAGADSFDKLTDRGDQPLLNHDVLWQIMRCVDDRRSISIFSKTCRTMHQHGVVLLARYPVIVSAINYRRYCDFFMADLSRCAYLDALCLDLSRVDVMDQVYKDAFVGIVRHARNLRTIAFQDICLVLIPDLDQAIIALECLHTLSYWGSSSTMHALLQVMHSPIKAVHLRFFRDGGGALASNPDLTAILAPIRDTLEAVDVFAAFWPASPTVTFPKLVSLHCGDYQTRDTLALVRMAPNLSTLFIPSGRRDFLSALEDTTLIRGTNIKAQAQHGSWKSLDTVNIPLEDWHDLAPSVPIRRMSIDSSESWIMPEVEQQQFQEILASSQPEYLCMHMKMLDCESVVDVLNLTPPTVTDLRLVAVLFPSPDASVLLGELPSVKPLSFTHLSLQICIPSDLYKYDSRDESPYHSLGVYFARLLHSLQYFQLELPNREDACWKVVRSDGDVSVHPVSSAEGKKSMSQHEESLGNRWYDLSFGAALSYLHGPIEAHC